MRLGDDLENGSQRRHVACHGPVDGARVGVVLAGPEGDACVRGLQPKDVAVAGWNSDAAAAVAAEPDGDETQSDGAAGARGGTAGVVVLVEGIGRRAVVGVVACCVEAELVHASFADNDDARFLQFLDAPGGDAIVGIVGLGGVVVDGAQAAAVAVEIVLVLDGARNAVQRA